MVHHWVEGNTAGKCSRCRKQIKSYNGITGTGNNFFFPQKLKIDFWEKVPKIVFLVSFLTYTKAFMSMNGRKHCVQNDE